MITKEEFLKDVAVEVEAIKKYATDEEKGRLSFPDLAPTNTYRCVYGLMTGECRSMRAIELIQKCCKRLVNGSPIVRDNSYENVKDCINGEMTDDINVVELELMQYTSALEIYITFTDANNLNLISFIKGETNKLEL